MQGLIGIAAFLAIAWIIGGRPRRVPWRVLISGVGLQFVLAILLLRVPGVSEAFVALNGVVLALEQATQEGAGVVFGFLAGGQLPYEETVPGGSFILAFRGLPLILVVSALSALLFHWRVLPWVVRGFSWALRRTMGIGGAEGLAVSANVFVGMVEAPLLIRPYVSRMTRSELLSLMTCGMATIAGTVMVLYATVLRDVIPNALGHILSASIISAPASVAVAKLMIPETGAATQGGIQLEDDARSAMDAITRGTIRGVELLISVIAMIIVLVAIVSLVNIILELIPDVGGAPLSLQRMLGWVMAPVVWLFGIPWHEAPVAGSLMGTKTVINEFVAYLELSQLPAGTIGERSRLILMYAMCGFANPGSLGIMIGGLGSIAPDRRSEIVSLGLRSIAGGTLAACTTAAVAGLFL